MVDYYGNLPNNYNVVVDYEAKKVKFTPVRYRRALSSYFHFLAILVFNYVVIFYSSVLVTALILDGVGVTEGLIESDLLIILFFIVAVIPILYSLIFFNKTFRKKYYPKFMAHANILSFFRKKKSIRINKKAIIDNKFIIPYFANICLEYKATFDFARYLQRIEIKNLYFKDDYKFICIFYFNGPIKKGNMDITFD